MEHIIAACLLVLVARHCTGWKTKKEEMRMRPSENDDAEAAGIQRASTGRNTRLQHTLHDADKPRK